MDATAALWYGGRPGPLLGDGSRVTSQDDVTDTQHDVALLDSVLSQVQRAYRRLIINNNQSYYLDYHAVHRT